MKDKEYPQKLHIDDLIDDFVNIVPEFMDVIEKRYSVLRLVNYLGPIGRRILSEKLHMTERGIRTASTALKNQGLIKVTQDGMIITTKGKNTLDRLKYVFHTLKGLKDLEEEVASLLGIQKVIIVPSSAEADPLVYNEIGKSSANYLKTIINDNDIIGLTGGTTVSEVISNFTCDMKKKPKNLTIVPARGGLGKRVEYQANYLVQQLAHKLDCTYKHLYTPDSLSKEAIESLLNEPSIKEITDLIEHIDILVFGMGGAISMAKRRGLGDSQLVELDKSGAVSEAFGYYFDKNGEIVHEISTIGIKLSTFKNLQRIIGVAGGEEKAEAIISISRLNSNLVLICDERVAKKIIFKFKEE